MLAAKTPHFFSSEEYLKLFENGVFEPGVRTELINGEIIQLAPLGFKHAKTQQLIAHFIAAALQPKDVFTTGSTLADRHNMLEPDVFVLKPNVTIANNYPHLDQIILVVEVADSTFLADMNNDGTGKLAVYARCKVPTVWVVEVSQRKIHVLTQPTADRYTLVETFSEMISLGDKTTKVCELIG
jgi:Uma2 family endonuclease